jgi:hypothetical protein
MTNDDEELDLLRDSSDPAMYRLLTDLERATTSALPAGQREQIARVLAQEARKRPASSRREQRPHVRTLKGTAAGVTDRTFRAARGVRQRTATVVVALLLALSGLAGYLRIQTVATVSAAQVLYRAKIAATSTASNGVIHEISSIHITPNADGATSGVPWLGTTQDGQLVRDGVQDSWAQFAGDHTLIRLDAREEDSFGRMRFHVVAANNLERSFDGRYDSVTISPWAPRRDYLRSRHYGVGLPADVPLPAAVVQQLLQGKQPQEAPGDTTRFLGQQRVKGVTLDMVQVMHPVVYEGSGGPVTWTQIFTYSIQAQSYIIDRSMITTMDGSGHVLGSITIQLIRREVLPVSALPRGIFTFTIPAGACVYSLYPGRLASESAPLCLPRQQTEEDLG